MCAVSWSSAAAVLHRVNEMDFTLSKCCFVMIIANLTIFLGRTGKNPNRVHVKNIVTFVSEANVL